MRSFLILIFSILVIDVLSQELLCNVRVNSSQVQTSDRRVFQSMQTSIYEFVNNNRWTNIKIAPEERIECSILINISKKISSDEFEASIHVQSTRPIYGTSYKSTMLNFIDNDFRFKYSEYQSLEFSENSFSSNLTSVLAFYINIILGLDFATFSEDGGNEYFSQAQKIVNNAQNARESGWKAFESDKNRYWLAHDLLYSRYSDFHLSLFKYHRLGLDILAEEPEDARFEITESLEGLKSIARENPSALLLKIFFDAKSDEIIKIYSGSYPNEKARIINILNDIDPSNSSSYQNISKENDK